MLCREFGVSISKDSDHKVKQNDAIYNNADYGKNLPDFTTKIQSFKFTELIVV